MVCVRLYRHRRRRRRFGLQICKTTEKKLDYKSATADCCTCQPVLYTSLGPQNKKKKKSFTCDLREPIISRRSDETTTTWRAAEACSTYTIDPPPAGRENVMAGATADRARVAGRSGARRQGYRGNGRRRRR